MKWKKWLENWDMSELKINLVFLETKWKPQTADKEAAWELYIELLTRVATQELLADDGDEKTALESIHILFPLTRDIIKKYRSDCMEFSTIAIVVLNQIIRPFTAKWHRAMIAGAFKKRSKCKVFRTELVSLQTELKKYTRMLGHMAGVERDLTTLEE